MLIRIPNLRELTAIENMLKLFGSEKQVYLIQALKAALSWGGRLGLDRKI